MSRAAWNVGASGATEAIPSSESDARQVAEVLASFNTWAFKREQPSSIAAIKARIEDAIQSSRPLQFVLYWGKGPRKVAADPDLACLDFLAKLAARVRKAHGPGAEIVLLFTDTHAELNGHARADADCYFAEVGDWAAHRGFKSRRLSSVARAAGRELAAHAAEVDRTRITMLADKAERWFRGEGSSRDGAERYLRANLVERRAVEIVFPRGIFATFNGSEYDFLFPERMPRFYMYSLRKGCSVKPWFLDANGQLAEAAH